MNLRIELKNGVMTAAMRGELDHHTASGLREEIDGTAKKVKPRVRMAALWNGRVAVTGLSPQLRRMAELSGVASLAALEDPVKEAVGK